MVNCTTDYFLKVRVLTDLKDNQNRLKKPAPVNKLSPCPRDKLGLDLYTKIIHISRKGHMLVLWLYYVQDNFRQVPMK